MEKELDRITQLPSDIIGRILCCLPIKDAGRTSLLSRKWRYKWAGIPSLVFTAQSTGLSLADIPNSDITNKLGRMIDHVLLLHDGPVHKFLLSHWGFEFLGIDRWILHLSRQSLKELVLLSLEGPIYAIPSSLFLCQDLVRLVLYKCKINSPLGFLGFKNLKSLKFRCVILTKDAVENLISSSPLLETLILLDLKGVSSLKIDAPNLQFLRFEGGVRGISFGSTRSLASVSVGINVDLGRVDECSTNMLAFFQHMSHVQILKLQNYSLKHLATGLVPRMLVDPLITLKCLSLCINLDNVNEILLALCLLRSSPNLKKAEFSWIKTVLAWWTAFGMTRSHLGCSSR
ncbi:F-box/FBD/LRR-repeat protein At1g13570-like isoform X2 [Punica granatum]|uniref:F-box/FBD/LRR-repeat protein At1g13570-like isoform X2 n=1 Tax=Punica granatum TaxID=22663 RepID=A0A6P8C132_PUNGR|nr:F-box/FBD/LRR-repeat protein At1g13570-like isoform X2 [Punica granatum]